MSWNRTSDEKMTGQTKKRKEEENQRSDRAFYYRRSYGSLPQLRPTKVYWYYWGTEALSQETTAGRHREEAGIEPKTTSRYIRTVA